MVSVSDTSALTALLQIGRADLLLSLFGRVVIPPAVRDELRRKHSVLPAWLEVIDPGTVPASVTVEGLHPGETAGIALALKLKAEVLLIDERSGRRVALAHGLQIIGVLGVLALAKRRELVREIVPLIEELRSSAGCRFSDRLIARVRRDVGE